MTLNVYAKRDKLSLRGKNGSASEQKDLQKTFFKKKGKIEEQNWARYILILRKGERSYNHAYATIWKRNC